ncbi:MAG: SDR family oxidoreductase [Phycisphaerales bacterium]|nr:SDR family oxidoreductase [Phycisphaerales bacterium]
MNPHDRVALITGAARRVGRAIALRLAREGCHIAAHYHTSRKPAEALQAEIRALGRECELFSANLADPRETDALAPHVITRFGRLDILINNASTFEPMRLDEFSRETWNRDLAINLTAPMALSHAAASELKKRSGRIINLCDAAITRPLPDYLAYAVSKGGLETLTRALARALAPEVNVVGVAPGVAEFPESYDQQTRDRLVSRIPLKRAGSPEDIAALIAFLLREGDYITGAIIPADGGRHIT